MKAGQRGGEYELNIDRIVVNLISGLISENRSSGGGIDYTNHEINASS